MTGQGARAIGIDLGGTNLRGAVVDADGALLAEARGPAPAGWPALRDAMAALVGELRVAVPQVVGVGVGAAGMVDHEGTVRYSPNVHAFADTPVGRDLAAATGLPVEVDNEIGRAHV